MYVYCGDHTRIEDRPSDVCTFPGCNRPARTVSATKNDYYWPIRGYYCGNGHECNRPNILCPATGCGSRVSAGRMHAPPRRKVAQESAEIPEGNTNHQVTGSAPQGSGVYVGTPSAQKQAAYRARRRARAVG